MSKARSCRSAGASPSSPLLAPQSPLNLPLPFTRVSEASMRSCSSSGCKMSSKFSLSLFGSRPSCSSSARGEKYAKQKFSARRFTSSVGKPNWKT